MKTLLLYILLVIISNISFPQIVTDSTTGLRCYSFDFQNCWGSDISLLPKRIPVETNHIILFADFKDQNKDTIVYNDERYIIIPIYIINTTGNPLELVNDDILVLQQYKDTLGLWIRSQSYDPGWSGSSLPINITLYPNEFMKTNTFQNYEGKKEITRFALYSEKINLTSNSGVGLVDVKEIEEAKIDYISKKFKSLDLLYKTVK